MNLSDILLLGMKKHVAAVERATGRIVWETKLPGGTGDFVTLLCTGGRIFACAGGHLHGLDLATGAVLWTNELPGYGYGVASLALPDGISAPETATLARLLAEQQAAAVAANSSATST